MSKVRHVLGISGGKDSAALAIYLRNNYPDLDIEYYFADTGKELDETYEFINNLEVYLGQKIIRLRAVKDSPIDPFDHFLARYGGYLPSKQARWCTRHLKLEPFEAFVGNGPTVSYVAIRGDEDREGYVSHKPNIQTIYPFRKNIWSEDVINKVLSNDNLEPLVQLYSQFANGKKRNMTLEVAKYPLSLDFGQEQKLRALLDLNVPLFNTTLLDYFRLFCCTKIQIKQIKVE